MCFHATSCIYSALVLDCSEMYFPIDEQWGMATPPKCTSGSIEHSGLIIKLTAGIGIPGPGGYHSAALAGDVAHGVALAGDVGAASEKPHLAPGEKAPFGN